MKLMQITYHFEFSQAIEGILDKHNVENFARCQMEEGKDCDGKHYGTQVFPGNIAIVNAKVPDEKVEPIFEDLKAFKKDKKVHHHLRAIVIPIERTL